MSNTDGPPEGLGTGTERRFDRVEWEPDAVPAQEPEAGAAAGDPEEGKVAPRPPQGFETFPEA